MDLTFATTDFFHRPSPDIIIPDLIIFRFQDKSYKVEVNFNEGWTKRTEYFDEPRDSKLFVVVRGKSKVVKIIDGKKAVTFRYLDIKPENIL